MSDHMKEAERLVSDLISAVDFEDQSAETKARAALLAHIQRGAVPEGYDIAPTFRGYAKLGIGQYVLHNCPRTDEDHPSLVIAIATEEEKAGRQVGELRQSQPGLMIQPERIAVRIDFKSVAALDALEQQLRFLREDSFPESLTTPAPDHFRDAAEMMAEPAGVPMPKPVAYGFGNTAITGHTNRLMMVRIDIPGGDQYAGAFWLPLVLADEAHAYGAACRAAGEAAGYARGLAEAGRLISLWIKDPDVQRMLEFARDAARKVTSWLDRLNGEAEDAMRGEECDLPPRGWRCTRGKGHSGPCAAVESPDDIEIVERAMKRLRGG